MKIDEDNQTITYKELPIEKQLDLNDFKIGGQQQDARFTLEGMISIDGQSLNKCSYKTFISRETNNWTSYDALSSQHGDQRSNPYLLFFKKVKGEEQQLPNMLLHHQV